MTMEKCKSNCKKLNSSCNLRDREKLIPMLGEFFRYLLSLDEYTLGLICQVVAPTGSEPVSVKTLSMLRGTSRQAVHRKILTVIGEHPELSQFFSPLIRKISSARRNFVKDEGVPGA